MNKDESSHTLTQKMNSLPQVPRPWFFASVLLHDNFYCDAEQRLGFRDFWVPKILDF